MPQKKKKNRSKVRAAAIKEVEAFHQGNSGDRDTNLLGGDIVLVVDPDLQANTTAYSLPFFIAEVIGPNNGEEVLVQIMRPSDLVSIDKKFLRWQGDDNVNLLWRPIILKSSVQLILELTPRGKKLTSKSLQRIREKFPGC